MGGDGVEYFSVLLVFIESMVDEVAQITSALGAAPGIGMGDAAELLFPEARGLALPARSFDSKRRKETKSRTTAKPKPRTSGFFAG